MDLGGSIPDWYKKKKSARHAKDGILKLIAYLEESNAEMSSELEATMSTGSEMNFYRELAQQHSFPAPETTITQEEQILRIRLQSRRSLKAQSPLNRASQHASNHHRSCVRIRSSITLTSGVNPVGDLIAESNADNHAEACGGGQCEHDHDVIVVRTIQ